jgi:hypothetical protein
VDGEKAVDAAGQFAALAPLPALVEDELDEEEDEVEDDELSLDDDELLDDELSDDDEALRLSVR